MNMEDIWLGILQKKQCLGKQRLSHLLIRHLQDMVSCLTELLIIHLTYLSTRILHQLMFQL